MDNQDMFYRQRTNTAQKLERMNIARRKAAMIKNVKVSDMDSSLLSRPFETVDDSELFVRKKAEDYENTIAKTSMLSHQMELFPHLPQNKFTKYAVVDGTSQTGIPTKTIGIFVHDEIPDHFKNYPIQVCVISSANIEEFIGLILYKCTVEHPEFEFESVENYRLYITEDNGDPDKDFPPLDVNEQVQKFQFNHLALAKRIQPQFERTFSVTSEADTSQSEPHSKITPLETSKSLNIRETANQYMETHDSLVESIFYQAYRVYFITKKHFKIEVQLGISGEKIEIDPIQQKNTKFWAKMKAIHYSMNSVAHCEILEEKQNRVSFRIIYSLSFNEQISFPSKFELGPSTSQASSLPMTSSSSEYHIRPQLKSSASFRNNDFECDPKTGDEIVKKINNILKLRSSIARREYFNRREKSKRSFISRKKIPI